MAGAIIAQSIDAADPSEKNFYSDLANNVDVIGYPLPEAESILRAHGVGYAIERTKPIRNFFPVDENRLYVVRQRRGQNGVLCLTAAAGPRREVS